MRHFLHLKYFIMTLSLLFVFNLTAQTNNQEFRATWVVTWEYINSGSTAEQNKARIREILDNHKKANMTSVLFQVRQSGTAYYQSSYEPWGYYVGYTTPDFDPLQYAIEEAHKRGLELHAWFNTFQVSSTYSGTIAAEHPEWICRDQSGTPMSAYRAASPGLKAVRDYTLNVAMEIVRNYDIDGLHLDYIRWSEYTTDDMPSAATQVEQESKLDGEFSENTIKKLTSPDASSRFLYDVEHPYSAGVPAGFTTWEDWWRASVTEFVHALHDSIQAVKPWVRLSPAVLGKYKAGGSTGWNGYYVVYQDAALWFNERYIDQLTPMHYHWTTGSGFYDELTTDWEPYIQEGIQKGILYSCGPGSYILDENNVWNNHPDIVNRVRDKNWVDGFQFFSYASWNSHSYWDDARNLFFKSKTKIRPIDTTSIPPEPTISLTKMDSLYYKITVVPNNTATENHWYAIYKSDDSVLNINDDEIVDVYFGNSSFTFDETFDFINNFYGTYRYYATSLDRYWNESDISNSFETDTINVPLPLLTTAPTNVRILQNDANSLTIECDSIYGAEMFMIYLSTTGDSFSLYDSSYSNKMVVSGLTENTIYYFKLSAKNGRGLSPLTQDVYAGVPATTNNSVLVVDGFDRGTHKTRYDYIRFYANPLLQRGYAFSHCKNESITNGLINLNDYEIVIWMLGDESTADESFSKDEQSLIINYLKAGGKLFVTGSEIGWDLDYKGDSVDKSFYTNYLKAIYKADAPLGISDTYYNVEAVSNSIFFGLTDFSFDDGTHGTFNVSWADAILATGGAVNILKYKNVDIVNGGAGIAFQGTFPSGAQRGALVHFGFPFETIYPEASRIEIMSKVFDVFEGLVNVDELEKEIPTQFALNQNYPNPFNPSTIISWQAPVSGWQTLKIYDALGREVATLVNEFRAAGNYEVEFNSAINNKQLASGVYYYQLRMENPANGTNFMETKKMIILK
jgi:uncharacterized lipoprotein YddW (UPF0748 family)